MKDVIRFPAIHRRPIALLIALWSGPAVAATTFTVNMTSDAKDRKITDSVCDTSRKRGKQCTLRAAIEESNDTSGADTINFNIGGTASVKTINVGSSGLGALPDITEAVTINGYTQSGASANTNDLSQGSNAVLKIQVNGINAGTFSDGLLITASNSTIKALVINRFFDNGVQIDGSGATGNKVEGNRIGTKADGSSGLGNTGDGVIISAGASNNTIGGATSAAGNAISNNGADGVSISSGTGNRVFSNFIFSNTGLGIYLFPEGVTANDTDDPDTGANNLQNFPVITSAIRSNSTNFTTISGTLNSNPSQNYTIQCFVAVPDPSGNGEGQIPAGADTTVTTDTGGDGSFACVSPVPQAGQTVTATATNTASGDTSEFSQNVGVVAVP